MTPTDTPATAPRKPTRRGIRKPGQWDVRMMISIPATIVLLVISMGVANYIAYLGFADSLRGVAPEVATDVYLRHILTILILFSLLALASGAAIVWVVLRPIREVADAVATIARGHRQKEVRISGGAFEIDQLGKTFNSMVDFINTMIHERDSALHTWDESGSLILDTAGRVGAVNRAGLEILGADRADLVGKALDEISRDKPELAPSFIRHLRESLAGPPVRGGGSETLLSPERAGQEGLSVMRSFLRDKDDNPTAIAFHFRDPARMRSLSQLFSRTDQLAALGTFTIGLSHELRNPLGSLKGTAQLLAETLGDRDECAPYLERIVREVNRLDRLVRELYDFSRSPVDHPEPHDFNEIVKDALRLVLPGVDAAHKEGREIVEALDAALPPVRLQRERVIRAISNVLINAFEHMPRGATLLLRTSPGAPDQPRSVALDVTNTGSSIPPEDHQKIFEPFYSTKQGGTGLGLAIAYPIVSQNHGLRRVDSDGGSTHFRFVFRDAMPQGEAREATP